MLASFEFVVEELLKNKILWNVTLCFGSGATDSVDNDSAWLLLHQYLCDFDRQQSHNCDGGVSYKMASLVSVSRKRLASAESAFLLRCLILPYDLSPQHNCRNYVRLWCGHYAYRSYQYCTTIHGLFSTNICLCYYSDDSVLLLNYGDLRAAPTRAETRPRFRLSHHFSILIRYKPLYRMYSYCTACRLSTGYEDNSVGCA